MRVVLPMMCGPVVLVWALCLAATAQEQPVELVAPQIGASELDAAIALPGQFSRATALPFEQVCDAIVAETAPASQEPVMLGTCSSTSGRVFAQARSVNGAFSSVRFKLSTSVAERMTDLSGLSDRLQLLASGLSIATPEGFVEAVKSGTDATCTREPLQFQFWRERGDIPRYNLVVKIVPGSDQKFSKNHGDCG